METFIQFMKLILPGLIELAKELFEAHNGDAEAANREIADRRSEVRARRAKRDAELDDKFGDSD